MKEFYQVTMSVTFTWVYRHRTNEYYFTSGVSNLSLISVIYEPEEQVTQEFNLYKGYKAFDFVGKNEYVLDGNYGAILFLEGRKEPDFYYYLFDTEMYHKMSICFVECMNLLLGFRGLYMWQEFFVKDERFPFNRKLAELFLADLELLFPHANSSILHEKLK